MERSIIKLVKKLGDLLNALPGKTLAEAITDGTIGGGSSDSSIVVKQVTKLGVTAATSSPYIIEIPTIPTIEFKRLPIEVLKFTPGPQDLITSQSDFNNSDASSFNPDIRISFDGKMKLKTNYNFDLNNEGTLGDGTLYSVNIDREKFKKIIEIKPE